MKTLAYWALLGGVCCADLPKDPNGWSVVTPSADSRVVYVSSSLGNNSNDGLSEATPKKTIAAGKALMRDGFPDHLLLKCGDVFLDEPVGRWQTSGRSDTEPQVLGSYACGARPEIHSSATVLETYGGRIVRHVAVIGLKFYCYKLDPTNPAYDPATTHGQGIVWLEPGGGVLFEDLYISHYLNGMNLQNLVPTETSSDFDIRRCVIVNSYSTTSHSQGIFLHKLNDITIEENVIDHNGWRDNRDGTQADGAATIFNHNIYAQYDQNTGMVVRGNILSRASSHGMQIRPGGVVEDNLFVRNPIGLLFGADSGNYPNGVTGRVSNNVVQEGNDINAANIRGFAVDLQNIQQCDFTGNVISHAMSQPINNNGLQIFGAPAYPSRGINISQNVWYAWDKGGPTKAGTTSAVTIDTEDANGYFDHTPISGTNYDSAQATFSDPTRTVATYSGSIGGAGTFEDFIAEARKQSKQHWRPEYTAAAVNTYIRAGFDQNPVPPEPDPIVIPIPSGATEVELIFK